MNTDRNGIVNQIMDALGSECERELAERMFDSMRADGWIYYDDTVGLDRQGLKIRDDVDLLAVAAEILGE